MNENTKQSCVFAALECRLTIEQICYERLRSHHDYISQNDLKKWQPRDVVKTLIQEVDPSVVETQTLSIGNKPLESEDDLNLEDYEQVQYIEIGTQVGFNANYLGQLWNALSHLSLHIPVPLSKDAVVSRYGDTEKIRNKVYECLAEFKRISKTTLVIAGFGSVVSFECCGCKSIIKRMLKTLKHEQVVNCINPNCPESYLVEKVGDECHFERRKVVVSCSCDRELALAHNHVGSLKINQATKVICPDCSSENLVRWNLYHAVVST